MRHLLACFASLLLAACTSSSGSSASTCAPDDVACQCAASTNTALSVPTPGGACAPDGLVCGTEGIVDCAGPGLCTYPPTCTCRGGRFSCVADVRACSKTECTLFDAGAEDAIADGGDAASDAGGDGRAD